MESRDEEILRAEQIKAVSKAWISHKTGLPIGRPLPAQLLTVGNG